MSIFVVRDDLQPVGEAKHEEDAKVAPLVVGRNAQRLEVLGPARVRAVAAVGRGVGVHEVAAAGLAHEAGGEVEAGLARRRVEVGRLVGRAADGLAGQGRGQDARDPVRAGVEPVELGGVSRPSE